MKSPLTPGPNHGAASSSSRGNGATARAVMMSGLRLVAVLLSYFNAHAVDLHRRRGGAGDLGKERALLGGALHQMHAEISVIRLQDGNDEAREARA